MPDTIRFRRNDRKMLEMIIFIAHLAGKRGVDIYHLAKIFFYAEKWHLNKHRRPIVGDTYIKMVHGPAPSGALDLVYRNDFTMPDRLIKQALASLNVTQNAKGPTLIRARRRPNTWYYFSKSDREAIRWAYKTHAKKSFIELREESHQEPAWQEAILNDMICYSDMMEAHPDKDAIVEHLEEMGQYIAL